MAPRPEHRVKRIPEPELMMEPHSVAAYAAADFDEPHSRFIELLGDRLPKLAATGRAVDLGCGAADIAVRFARAWSSWRIDAVDGSLPMLAAAADAVGRAGLAERIVLHSITLPAPAPERYDLVFCNSLLHHLADPAVLWRTVIDWAHPKASVFVMDLARPASEARAAALVELYASQEPEVLRKDFYGSLLAAYTPVEVRLQLAAAGLSGLTVEVVSDRHWIVWGCVRASPCAGGARRA